jgi:hypothetical protein
MLGRSVKYNVLNLLDMNGSKWVGKVFSYRARFEGLPGEILKSV